MKPTIIATLDGIYCLRSDGFYTPYEAEKETKWPLYLGWGIPMCVAWSVIAAGYWLVG